jgi:hypothetical protein
MLPLGGRRLTRAWSLQLAIAQAQTSGSLSPGVRLRFWMISAEPRG